MDWIDDTAETWTYVSATKFKTSGDKTKKYQHGSSLRLKQGGDYKYFYVEALGKDASDTYVTVNGGSHYSLTNASITDNYHSYGIAPEGFPTFFFYNATWTTLSGTAPSLGNGTLSTYFNIVGELVFVTVGLQVGTTTVTGNGGQWRFSLPTSNADALPMDKGQVFMYDNGITAYAGNVVVDTSLSLRPQVVMTNGTYAQDNGVTQTAPFTWGNGDIALLQAYYHMNTAVEQL